MYASKLEKRLGQRFESARRLFRDLWEDKTKREIVLESLKADCEVRKGRPQPI
jgi:hypothetical protein